MTPIRTATLLVLAALAAPTLAAGPVGNAAAGKEKSKTCAACHGATGNESLDATYPKLAGQYPEYLTKALHDYKSGKRSNAIMKTFATPLSDADMANLGAYYQTLKK